VISATSLENRLWDLIHKGNPSVQDFQKERLAMVEEQLRRRNIFDGRVLQAMSRYLDIPLYQPIINPQPMKTGPFPSEKARPYLSLTWLPS
jgi:hypothetical protein